MNATYRKNLKSIATACKNYTDEKVSDLEWRLGANNLVLDTDTSTGYTSSVPSGTIAAKFTKVGGMSYPYNQIQRQPSSASDIYTNNVSNASVVNNVVSFTAIAQNADINLYPLKPTLNSSHKYFISTRIKASSTEVGIYFNYVMYNLTQTNTFENVCFIVSGSNSFIIVRDSRSSSWDEVQAKDFVIIDLTALGITTTDVDTAKTQLLAMGYKLDGTDEYSTGKLRHAKVSSVDITGTNQTTINKPIPASIYNDTRWGLGYDSSNYNYLDLSNYHFKGNIGIVDLGTLFWFYQPTTATPIFSTALSNIGMIPNDDTVIMIGYTAKISFWSEQGNDMCVASGGGNLNISNSNYTDAEAFKTAMSGVYLVYELAEAFDEDKSSAFINWDNPIEFTDDYGTVQYTNEDELDLPYSITYLKEVAK